MRESHLERRFSLVIRAGLPGVVLGAVSILHVPPAWATLALGLLTLGLGLYSVFKPKLGMEFAPKNREGRGLLIGSAGLFAVGFLNGSITSGTGLFLTIWLIRHFGLDYKRAVAYTLILCGFVWNGTGALGAGHDRNRGLGLDAGAAGRFHRRRLPGQSFRHCQGESLDQAGVRDQHHRHRSETDLFLTPRTWRDYSIGGRRYVSLALSSSISTIPASTFSTCSPTSSGRSSPAPP